MTAWPVLDRDPVQLPALGGLGADLWPALLDLSEVGSGEWTLIGGQMVLLHALESGAAVPRVSTDIDLLVDVRMVVGGMRGFVASVERQGFSPVGVSAEGITHRYRRGAMSIDVLAPEGLGSRVDLTTTPPGRTLQVPGGTQALARTELVPVAFGGRNGLVPRPSLLGAVVAKAVAVGVDDVPDAQRMDLGLLLSLVEDPLALACQLTRKDRQRLRRRAEMAGAHEPVWAGLPAAAADRGRAAYRILAAGL